MLKQIAVRAFVPVLLVLSLAGCGAIIAAEILPTPFTGKTGSDHVVSLLSGKDCSFLRKDRGLTYCVEDEVPVDQPDVFCKQTLASVTCYKKPDVTTSQ